MTAAEYVDPLAWEMAVWLDRFFDPDAPIRELGKLGVELTSGLRTLAVLQLLARDDRVHFFSNLVQSARVRLHYLGRLRQAGIDNDHHQASARYRPLLDAVAAGNMVVADQIIRLSPTEFRQGHEYIDDYCFAQLMMIIIRRESDQDFSGKLLEEYGTFLEGAFDARFHVARALVQRDQKEFESSFSELLQQRSTELKTLKNKGQMDDAHVAANRFVYVDALAILKLAEWQGLRTEAEYTYCPSAVRNPARFGS